MGQSHKNDTSAAAVAKDSSSQSAPGEKQGTSLAQGGQKGTSSQSQEWTHYFTSVQWAIFIGSLIVGLMLRWTMLDMRPYHHDESLHGMYGRYFYDFPNANYYKYDPMLHGPMLYNSMRFIYAMFGDSLWAARTPVCIMGSLFMFVPFLYRRYFAPVMTLLLTGTIALSPTMVYWSRFLREDYWVVSGMLFTLFGFTIAPRAWKAFFVMLGITIQWCTKENVFVTLAVFVGFLVFEAFFQHFILKNKDTYLRRIATFVRNNLPLTCVSAAACFLIYCWFYGAGFRYPKGIIDGLGGKAIDYWAAHHKMERIKGPFNFHVYVTAWYELPIFVAFLTHLALFYRKALPQIRFCAACIGMVMVLSCYVTDPQTIEQNSISLGSLFYSSTPLWSRSNTCSKESEHLQQRGTFLLPRFLSTAISARKFRGSRCTRLSTRFRTLGCSSKITFKRTQLTLGTTLFQTHVSGLGLCRFFLD
jgi:uncharacterized protein (TIGR03663 family)